MVINPTLITTPLGAAVGIALTRKILPKSERTVNKYIIGGGIGAGAGFVAGEGVKAIGEANKFSDLNSYKSFIERNPTASISKEEMNLVEKLRPSFEAGDYTKVDKNLAAERAEGLAKRNVLLARAEILENSAKKENDALKKAKLMRLAENNRDEAGSLHWGDRGTRLWQTLPWKSSLPALIDKIF